MQPLDPKVVDKAVAKVAAAMAEAHFGPGADGAGYTNEARSFVGAAIAFEQAMDEARQEAAAEASAEEKAAAEAQAAKEAAAQVGTDDSASEVNGGNPVAAPPAGGAPGARLMGDKVVRICDDYERRSRAADACQPRDPGAADVVVLPVIRVERPEFRASVPPSWPSRSNWDRIFNDWPRPESFA